MVEAVLDGHSGTGHDDGGDTGIQYKRAIDVGKTDDFSIFEFLGVSTAEFENFCLNPIVLGRVQVQNQHRSFLIVLNRL